MLKEIMLKERIDEDEIKAIIRTKGLASLQDADAVVLETDGSLTVMANVENLDAPIISQTIKPNNLKRQR